MLVFQDKKLKTYNLRVDETMFYAFRESCKLNNVKASEKIREMMISYIEDNMTELTNKGKLVVKDVKSIQL